MCPSYSVLPCRQTPIPPPCIHLTHSMYLYMHMLLCVSTCSDLDSQVEDELNRQAGRQLRQAGSGRTLPLPSTQVLYNTLATHRKITLMQVGHGCYRRLHMLYGYRQDPVTAQMWYQLVSLSMCLFDFLSFLLSRPSPLLAPSSFPFCSAFPCDMQSKTLDQLQKKMEKCGLTTEWQLSHKKSLTRPPPKSR